MSTLTVYPDEDSGSTTLDGYLSRSGVSESFSDIRAGFAVGSNTGGVTVFLAYLDSGATTDEYINLLRNYSSFDTSALTASAVIDSAVFSTYGSFKASSLGTPAGHLVASTQANANALTFTDFQELGSISFGSISYASFSTGVYNDIILNASGEAHINKTGVTMFGKTSDWDLFNSPPTWSASSTAYLGYQSTDTAGTTQDPKLVITYTLPLIEITGFSSISGISSIAF